MVLLIVRVVEKLRKNIVITSKGVEKERPRNQLVSYPNPEKQERKDQLFTFFLIVIIVAIVYIPVFILSWLEKKESDKQKKGNK